MHQIRLLTPADAGELYALRLEALQGDPDAFLATYEEELARGLPWFRERLGDGARDPACGVMGGFVDGALVGFVGFMRTERVRAQHKAHIWGTWVAPPARRRGLARAMMLAVLAHLRAVPGVERVDLGLITVQQAASQLYRSLGFERFGLELQAMKVGDRYLDQEHLVLRLGA